MKIKELIIFGRKKLNENNVDDYSIIAKSLAKYILNMNDAEMIINEENEVEDIKQKEYIKDIDEIINGKPLQYITHKQEFIGIEFYVNENVLIPQPDTEILVEEVISICKNYNDEIKILDICTGSGAIAISVAKNVQNAEISASDISEDALEVARKNAKSNNVKIEFINSDMFENIKDKYDIIVSNPPYIKTKVISTLDKQVQNEPNIALDGGNDGLEFYRILAKEAKKYLKTNGYLCIEIGYDQREEVEQLLEENHFSNIYAKKDLAGNNRIIVGKKE